MARCRISHAVLESDNSVAIQLLQSPDALEIYVGCSVIAGLWHDIQELAKGFCFLNLFGFLAKF
jgi:hypothetical protein